jgi:hypothetical protein
MLPCEKGHLNIVELLINANADLNAQNKVRMSFKFFYLIVVYSSYIGYPSILADINILGQDYCTGHSSIKATERSINDIPFM